MVTGALSPAEQRGFLEAGFDVHEHLHLLVLDKSVPSRRCLRGHRSGGWEPSGDAVSEVDAASFAPFWRLDRVG